MTRISQGEALAKIGGALLEELQAPGTMLEKHARAFLRYKSPITDEKELAKLFEFIEEATAARIGRWLQERGILKYRAIYGPLFTGKWKDEHKKTSARLKGKRLKTWQGRLKKLRKESERKRTSRR